MDALVLSGVCNPCSDSLCVRPFSSSTDESSPRSTGGEEVVDGDVADTEIGNGIESYLCR